MIDVALHDTVRKLELIYSVPVVGASGAIYGLLMGFGMLFPNVELMLLFLPVPVKAKYFIPLLMVGELYLGINQFSWDNIAHFAHLGGALFGFIIIRYWSRGPNRFF
jgi:rhomboid-like protein